jgi:hypothetical protein
MCPLCSIWPECSWWCLWMITFGSWCLWCGTIILTWWLEESIWLDLNIIDRYPATYWFDPPPKATTICMNKASKKTAEF